MNQALLTAIIGALAAIVGAVLSFLGTRYKARQDIEKLKLEYKHKEDEYKQKSLEEYRDKTIDTLYKPIYISITKLRDQYDHLYRQAERKAWEVWPEQLQEEFRKVCEEYIEQITAIISEGHGVYLTQQLDENLRSFTDFLNYAIKASKGDFSERYSFVRMFSRDEQRQPHFDYLFRGEITLIQSLITDVTLGRTENPQQEIPQKKKRHVSLGE